MTTPRLVSDDHALMALGSVSAMIASERDNENMVRIPELPAWLELWEIAIDRTRADALAALRGEADRDPSHDERLEIETIAQGHYEAYTRLDLEGNRRTGGFVAWEAIPHERRMLMLATIADMVAGGLILVGPQAAQPKGSRELWVVFDGTPGPQGPRFVEVEDPHGRSHGLDRGLRWEAHPDPDAADRGLHCLGPFPAPPMLFQEAFDRDELIAALEMELRAIEVAEHVGEDLHGSAVRLGDALLAFARDRHSWAVGQDPLTPEEAEKLYLWAIGDGRRNPPDDDDEFRTVGRGLRKLVETARAGGLLEGEALDLDDEAQSMIDLLAGRRE